MKKGHGCTGMHADWIEAGGRVHLPVAHQWAQAVRRAAAKSLAKAGPSIRGDACRRARRPLRKPVRAGMSFA